MRFLLILPFFFLAACEPCRPLARDLAAQNAFAEKIAAHRETYKASFLEIKWAPLKEPGALDKLNFFPANPDYRFDGTFHPNPDAKPFKMATSDGTQSDFSKYGEIAFKHNLNEHRLSVFKLLKPGVEYYLIAFSDPTNGDSTYGAGRYLDFKPKYVNDGKFEVDFNKCYNPWCHYAPKFPCPLPPKENHLTIPILAGEKLYGSPEDRH